MPSRDAFQITNFFDGSPHSSIIYKVHLFPEDNKMKVFWEGGLKIDQFLLKVDTIKEN